MPQEITGSHGKDHESLVQQLMRESETTLTHDEVENIFEEEYLRLESDPRVKSYLNLLSYQWAMKRLREGGSSQL